MEKPTAAISDGPSSGWVLPDVDGITNGMWDMARIGMADHRPAITGDAELDIIVGLRGLESRDAQPLQSGAMLQTPAGPIPVGLVLDDEGRRIVGRCIETLEARKMWLRMLRAVDADLADPPAWATTVSEIVANRWAKRGGSLAELHSQIRQSWLQNVEPFDPSIGDDERRMLMLSSYVEIPGFDDNPRIAFSACPGGSRVRLRILTESWALVDSDWAMLNIDEADRIPETVLAARAGRPLSELIAPSAVPILDGFNPTLIRATFEENGLFALLETNAVPMATAPQAALQAIGLAEAPAPHLCPWWVAIEPRL